ncbi:alanine--glyoxylate aminotransferase family protein [Candidatus Kaiserbacteria bacterium]|nr:alanine--glyoxylate aminotransferase family protein [Candidatus Kaiserbacteria bacterium]
MFTLSPGPSQISPETKDDIRKAIDEGILEISHRSSRFTDISRLCIQELRAYLNVPADYRIFYFDSATHVWHSLAANVVEKSSFHFVNGSFSGKAMQASKMLGKDAHAVEAPWGEQCDFASALVPKDAELITVCCNETSTGVKMTDDEIRLLREKYPDAILAVDITSCGGGIPLSMTNADVWYFSVQKCFGLPAGLAICIVSPLAYARSLDLQKAGKNLAGIWAWGALEEMMSNDLYQTPQTPNVMNIYLLGSQCQRWNKSGGLSKCVETTLKKKWIFEEWMQGRMGCAYFVQDEEHRSDTVFVVGAAQDNIKSARELLQKKGIELGTGYGRIKKDTFRIANFPAITESMLLESLDILSLHFPK